MFAEHIQFYYLASNGNTSNGNSKQVPCFLTNIHIRCYVDPNDHCTNNGNSGIIAIWNLLRHAWYEVLLLRCIGELEADH